MVKSKEQLQVLPDDSTDVFKRNVIDRYMDRPKSGKFACLKNVCLAQFASYYYKKSSPENDYQTEIIGEDIEDKDNDIAIGLPKKIVLEKSREVMTSRNQSWVLPHYKPSRKLHPEKFAYHLLLLFYSFAKEEDQKQPS